jgi:putative phosphoserine phosphatase/1-acylglycerol-3-phosphate O-acyltransferase
VKVLPPISVADWSLDDLEERIDAVRDLFVETLRDWPNGGMKLLGVKEKRKRKR